jgi:transposase
MHNTSDAGRLEAMPLPVRIVQLKRGDRAALEEWVRARTTPPRVVERARIVLASAEGLSGSAICSTIAVSRPTVSLWLDRYEAEGREGLLADRPRSGRPRQLDAAEEARIVAKTLREPPPDGGTHWSTRLMAHATGWDQATISRLWRANGLKPHQVAYFKVSTDPAVVTKLRDMVGLYVNPPQRAVVFSMDEKRQIQALDRTQPGPPLKKGRAGTVTHDDKRHGTTTLFAALNVGTGTVQHECRPKHTQKNFLAFMTRVERTVPRGVSIHVILDNYSTHKTPDVAKWLRRHRRVHFHFTPTSASWLNLVALLFNELSRRQLRRLAVTSVDELIATITTYLDRRNEAPTPFIWTASVRSILAKVRKAQGTLASDH